jgi:hypothetical protein
VRTVKLKVVTAAVAVVVAVVCWEELAALLLELAVVSLAATAVHLAKISY